MTDDTDETSDTADDFETVRGMIAELYDEGALPYPVWLYDTEGEYIGTDTEWKPPEEGDTLDSRGTEWTVLGVSEKEAPNGHVEHFETRVRKAGPTITPREGTEGMAHMVCSECNEPIVEYGKDDGPYFDRRECGCPGGSPEHGWRMLQAEEVENPDADDDGDGDEQDA